ncbi:MAG: hypothetical protein ABIJ16_07545 [Bacteroidota bacterium]
MLPALIFSQDYNRSIGIRGGINSGLTYRQFYNTSVALEAIASFEHEGFRVTALRENHKFTNFGHCDKLFHYYGYGAHAGFIGNEPGEMFPVDHAVRYSPAYPVIGLDAIFGLEYRVIKWPVVIGIDYMPYFDLFGPNYFNLNMGDVAFSIRYTF